MLLIILPEKKNRKIVFKWMQNKKHLIEFFFVYDKISQQLEMEEKFFNVIKDVCGKSEAILSGERLNAFSFMIGNLARISTLIISFQRYNCTF